MAQYQDVFNFEEFKLFRKFNNKHERKGRHIDCYHIDNENQIEKIEYNQRKLKEDLENQLISMEDYFSNPDSLDDIGGCCNG